MIALSSLIDSLLAAGTGPRAEVSAIKREAEIGATGDVPLVERAENEVRLPSRAAMERLVPSAVADAPHPPGKGGADARESSVAFEWSAAARIIRSVLAQERGDAGPVRSMAPLWTPSAPAGALAGSLAGAVEYSGLFYESHLAQFAAGARTLAQMQSEPHARWSDAALSKATAMPAGTELPSVGPVMVGVQLAQAASSPTPGVSAPAAPLTADAPDLQGDVGAPSAQLPSNAAPAPAASRMQAAYRQSAAPAAAEIVAASRFESQNANGPSDLQPTQTSGLAASRASTDAIVQVPQAVTLIHQQLDLLATSVFRWSGQAWPGVPMQWSIHPAVHESEDEATKDCETAIAAERVWFTTLSMQLPRLGVVDVRLGVAGDTVQAALQAGHDTAAQLAKGQGAVLANRLEAAGLRLREFQVRAAAQAMDAQVQA